MGSAGTRHLRTARWLVAAVVLFSPASSTWAQAEVYRCASPRGEISYQAQACRGDGSRSYPTTQSFAGAGARPAVAAPGAPALPAGAQQWGSAADVIVVSGYQFASAATQVHLDHPARPVLLILSSYAATNWQVALSSGTSLKAVVVSSLVGRSSVQTSQGVPLVNDILPYAYDPANIRFRELIERLHAQYGVTRVLALRGSYTLPSSVSVAGPHAPDPMLTSDGVQAESARRQMSFALAGIDGRRRAWTNSGPKEGRDEGTENRGVSSNAGSNAVALADDGAAYALMGNGSTLLWFPKGLAAAAAKVEPPSHMPRLSWASGLAWDTRKGILAIVSFGGEGYFYRYDTRGQQWLGASSLQNKDLVGLAHNASTNRYVGITDYAELMEFSEAGEVLAAHPLAKLLPDLGSTYDRNNGRLKGLMLVSEGQAVAIINVRDATVTHIWTYELDTRRAQLTYKLRH